MAGTKRFATDCGGAAQLLHPASLLAPSHLSGVVEVT